MQALRDVNNRMDGRVGGEITMMIMYSIVFFGFF
jgi:hypothetical protein